MKYIITTILILVLSLTSLTHAATSSTDLLQSYKDAGIDQAHINLIILSTMSGTIACTDGLAQKLDTFDCKALNIPTSKTLNTKWIKTLTNQSPIAMIPAFPADKDTALNLTYWQQQKETLPHDQWQQKLNLYLTTAWNQNPTGTAAFLNRQFTFQPDNPLILFFTTPPSPVEGVCSEWSSYNRNMVQYFASHHQADKLIDLYELAKDSVNTQENKDYFFPMLRAYDITRHGYDNPQDMKDNLNKITSIYKEMCNFNQKLNSKGSNVYIMISSVSILPTLSLYNKTESIFEIYQILFDLAKTTTFPKEILNSQASAAVFLIDYHLNQKQIEEAEHYFNTIKSLNDNNPDARLDYSYTDSLRIMLNYYSLKGNNKSCEELLSQFQKILTQHPKDTMNLEKYILALFDMSVSYNLRNDNENALYYYNQFNTLANRFPFDSMYYLQGNIDLPITRMSDPYNALAFQFPALTKEPYYKSLEELAKLKSDKNDITEMQYRGTIFRFYYNLKYDRTQFWRVCYSFPLNKIKECPNHPLSIQLAKTLTPQ